MVIVSNADTGELRHRASGTIKSSYSCFHVMSMILVCILLFVAVASVPIHNVHDELNAAKNLLSLSTGKAVPLTSYIELETHFKQVQADAPVLPSVAVASPSTTTPSEQTIEPALKRQKIVNVVSLTELDQEDKEGEDEKEGVNMDVLVSKVWDLWNGELRESDAAYRGIDAKCAHHCDTIAVIGQEVDLQLATESGRSADEILDGLIKIMHSIRSNPTIFGLVYGIRKANGDDDIALKAMSIDIGEKLLRQRSSTASSYLLFEDDIKNLFHEATGWFSRT
jgi:hypothetical protein